MTSEEEVLKRLREMNSGSQSCPKGKIWLTLLIEYDINGNSKILKSFSKPASDSGIKMTKKEKVKEDNKLKFKVDSEKSTERLF